MSRGIGDTQRAALTLLADAHDESQGVWIDELAGELGITPRRCRTMVASLVEHGQAHTEIRGWRERIGETGPLVYRVPTGKGWTERVTAETPGARPHPWADDRWLAPGGIPRRRTLVCLGPYVTPEWVRKLAAELAPLL